MQELPAFLRDSMVEIRFAEPVHNRIPEEFRRVRLGAELLDRGERELFLANVFQPQRINAPCASCRALMKELAPQLFQCTQPRCLLRAIKQSVPISRGIVDVVAFPEDAVNETVNGKPVIFVKRSLVVLDRRYSEVVHKVVRASCQRLAEENGARLA